jgi:hypothetical protein
VLQEVREREKKEAVTAFGTEHVQASDFGLPPLAVTEATDGAS